MTDERLAGRRAGLVGTVRRLLWNKIWKVFTLVLLAVPAVTVFSTLLVWSLGGSTAAQVLLVAGGVFAALTIVAVMAGVLAVSQTVSVTVSQRSREQLRHIDEVRAKQSRHEYLQEVSLDRIERSVAVVRGDVEVLHAGALVSSERVRFSEGAGPDAPRVLFVTSNGAGMGHITRCLAIAGAAQGCLSTGILTLSSAHEVVRRAGHDVSYFPSPDATTWGREAWHRWFASYLHELLVVDRPDLVVFDGTVVYRGLTESCRRFGVPLVWLRRGLWKNVADRTQYDDPHQYVDHLLVPGDLGEPVATTPDREGTSVVAPITLANRVDALEAAEARAALGLRADGRYALIQIGHAELNAGLATTGLIAELIHSHAQGIEPVVLTSPVARLDEIPTGVTTISELYPLAPFLRAFDFGVTAAGYNSVHESVEVGLPTILLPNGSTLTDDQPGRARSLAAAGLAIIAEDVESLRQAVTTLSDDAALEKMRVRLAAEPPLVGATQAATVIATLASRFRADPMKVMNQQGVR